MTKIATSTHSDFTRLDKEYTFQESAHILTRAISSIVDENDETIFSMVDILGLLRSVNAYVPGEFEIQRTHSHHYQVVYRPKEEVVASFKERWEGFIE